MSFLFLYITIFTVYFTILALVSIKPQRKYRDKYTFNNSNLCVVVYASGKTDTLENLIRQLKNQSYPKQNYTIYTILDKCEEISELTLQSDLNVNVININNLEPIGKSQAYSIIAEKLYDIKDLDAYVFLDASNYVETNFLENINFYLTKYQVFNANVCYLPQDEELTFWQNVKSVYSVYVSKFINISRTRLGLTNIINTDSFIIKKDLLNKMASFNFKNIISEVEYTYKLAKEGVKVACIDEIQVYKSINNFDFRIPSLSKRLSILWSNKFDKSSLIGKEFLLSLAIPNWLTCVCVYLLVLKHSYVFPFCVNYSNILISAIILLLAFCISLLNLRLSSKEYLYLLTYPLLSIAKILYNIPFIRGIRNIFKQTTRQHVIEKMTTNIIVTDGVNEFPCQLELISDDGLAKVTFINKNKKYTTKNNHLRMIDALKELTIKLSEHGLTLKVCQACKYFQPVVDGSTNMIKGCCNCQFQGRTPGDMIPTLIWNTCPRFEEQNVVNLF
ncbi:glycosyltransferase family 2 protein [bacterium]|nr:glycosyltransferase family 2 protein [bacterium]